ncbi:KH domain containing protein [Euroglyphus maynei]|uniref:KH domain containing protein n=1 Tax=Euroglyphus maynei TaxID=6958 RepID=A0A1Y3B3P9_EURMA|nr:KH domain containing protein [Euroglyphus maynei]
MNCVLLRASHIPILVFVFFGLARGAYLVDFSNMIQHRNNLANVKRDDPERCHPTQPFRCPGNSLICISIQYLCETANFLQSLLANHGPNYLEKLFGKKARDALAPLGGSHQVAVALSESETLDDFASALHLMKSDKEHLRNILIAVESGDLGLLKSMGIRDSELTDLKLFLDKLVQTGFMD